MCIVFVITSAVSIYAYPCFFCLILATLEVQATVYTLKALVKCYYCKIFTILNFIPQTLASFVAMNMFGRLYNNWYNNLPDTLFIPKQELLQSALVDQRSRCAIHKIFAYRLLCSAHAPCNNTFLVHINYIQYIITEHRYWFLLKPAELLKQLVTYR